MLSATFINIHRSLSDFRVANLVDKLFLFLQLHAQFARCFSMLFVVYSSGVSRATLSCSLRPSARSSSSQTSSPSPPILMSSMKVPKNSVEDRCVLRSITLFFLPVHHHNYLAHTDPLPSVCTNSLVVWSLITNPGQTPAVL